MNDMDQVNWHDTDDFWENFAPFMFPESRWAGTPVEVDRLTGLLAIPADAAILDLGCGPGRHSLELARRGYRVTGVDRTRQFLEQARQKGEVEGLPVTFIQADMREFRRPDNFDFALSLFTSFGYFEDPTENRQVIANVFDSLRPKGKFLLEVMGKEVLARIYQERDWSELDGRFLLQERLIIANWDQIKNRWLLLDGGRQFEVNFTHWLYSAHELTGLLRDCGFRQVEVYGNLLGDPYDDKAQRLVTIAHKS